MLIVFSMLLGTSPHEMLGDVISDWLVPLYQRLRPLMPADVIQEGDLLAEHDPAELAVLCILYGVEHQLLTADDRAQAVAWVESGNGISFRKLRDQLLSALGSVPVAA
ncbi:MAG: hypothetical protein LBK28_06170 [Propionibacteriaceae bacterium]|nr:hypothetical protein [Propionibacteriaceae bacterium]